MTTRLAQDVGGRKIAILIAILALFAILAHFGNKLSEEEQSRVGVPTPTVQVSQPVKVDEGLTSTEEKRILGVLLTIGGLVFVFGIVLPLSLEYRKYKKGKRSRQKGEP